MADRPVVVYPPNRIRPEFMAYDPETRDWALGETETEARYALRAIFVARAIAEEEWPDFGDNTNQDATL